MTLNLKVAETSRIKFKVSEYINETGGSVYDGEYEITPRPFEQTELETAGKKLTENVKVLKIPYSEVDNNAGGHTVTIGGIELWK